MRRRDLLLAGSASALLAACGGGGDDVPNLVQLAQSTPELSTLADAVAAAGLADTLSSGTYTLFAPTNAAFASLLTELGVTREQLLADRTLLTSVLTYHAVPARVERSQIPLGRAIGTVQGSVFKIDSGANGLVVTDGRNRSSRIGSTDIQAANGVAHLVDRVLLPPNRNIVQTAQAVPQFSLLVEAVVAAGLQGTLSAAGPFTVLAPTNDAFAALLAELGTTKEALFANRPLLTQVLTYHVIPGRVLRAEIPLDVPIATVQGQALRINAGGVVTDARNRTATIRMADVLATNGVVHAIDRVILPAA